MDKSIYFVALFLSAFFSNLVSIQSQKNTTKSLDKLIENLQLKYKTELNNII